MLALRANSQLPLQHALQRRAAACWSLQLCHGGAEGLRKMHGSCSCSVVCLSGDEGEGGFRCLSGAEVYSTLHNVQ